MFKHIFTERSLLCQQICKKNTALTIKQQTYKFIANIHIIDTLNCHTPKFPIIYVASVQPQQFHV